MRPDIKSAVPPLSYSKLTKQNVKVKMSMCNDDFPICTRSEKVFQEQPSNGVQKSILHSLKFLNASLIRIVFWRLSLRTSCIHLSCMNLIVYFTLALDYEAYLYLKRFSWKIFFEFESVFEIWSHWWQKRYIVSLILQPKLYIFS